MNAVNNETNSTLKQLSNDCIKSLATENEYNKLENSQPRIENPDYTENEIKINEMKQNIIREHSKITGSDMKDRAHLKKIDKN